MPKRRPEDQSKERSDFSRRDFLSTSAVGTLGLVTARPATGTQSPDAPEVPAGERIPVRLEINGRERALLA